MTWHDLYRGILLGIRFFGLGDQFIEMPWGVRRVKSAISRKITFDVVRLNEMLNPIQRRLTLCADGTGPLNAKPL